MGQQLLYVFGSQALSFTYTDLARIRAAISEDRRLQWISPLVAELPSVVEEFGRREEVSLPAKVVDDIKSLPRWLTADTPPSDSGPLSLSNILLGPLVVLSHLIEYTQLAESTFASGSLRGGGAFGLCTGSLSAFAVAASRNRDDIAKYGAVALRIVVLVSAIVDAHEIQGLAGPAKSFAAAWSAPITHDQVAQIATSVPNTYVAVRYDDCRATVTTSACDAHTVQAKLQAAGVVITEVGLRGRFHWTGHRASADSILAFCRDEARYHFPDLANLALQTWSNQPGAIPAAERLHEVAICSILIRQPQWLETFVEALQPLLDQQDSRILTFGSERSVPPSLSLKVRGRLRHATELVAADSSLDSASLHTPFDKDNDIAIVGMSCKVAGAESLEEFWELLCQANSQHREAPTDRFVFETPFRNSDPKRKWYGNFIDDYDCFDHKFFKKSPREASSTDPQQRQLLQISYQAVQQSGYFKSQIPDVNVGCYIGVCSVDYENNIACHEPNAYSAIGNLKGFISGKISHYFGWTGPGLTIDTACSSSAVAIHQACQAILSGECNSALAGGTHIMTSPLWFQNLAGASFLSPTGSCKPFDAAADGYCRGEGVATVFLKRKSTAVADGNTIFATIAATAVQQNENCTPIFVPNSPSLSHLFRKVTTRARLSAEQITVVEAHGTGTPVGDPVEYNSVREVLGGSKRRSTLALGSVKGLVGHLECTSGVISLIKLVLMMLKNAIPPQASFQSLNPAIKTQPDDQISIPTSVTLWHTDFKAALINNYGASGSNASIVVKQAPLVRIDNNVAPDHKYPFCFAALDRKSLCKYIEPFRLFLHEQKLGRIGNELGNISFNVSREFNPALSERLILTAASIPELDDKLRKYDQMPSAIQPKLAATIRPVIFSFGGQSSTFVGLSQQIYDRSCLLQKHLDDCNATCISLGIPSILPDIFKHSKIDDLALLHAMLFSLQYSCAQTWIDSGVAPSALVGHSFGELTALAVSGALDLRDCLQAIVGRAKIIQDSWGADVGAMMAVEGDIDEVKQLVREGSVNGDPSSPVTIACFNGTRQFTIAGPQRAMDLVSEALSCNATYASLRTKTLNVTHAYHSVLVDPLMDKVEQSTRGIRFRNYQIPLERATEFASDVPLTCRLFAEHMRNPVFFSHAVQRLATKYPSAVWLEAGSSTSVTHLAKRSIPDTTEHHFQDLDIINSGNTLDNLSETTAALWRAGVPATFWLHHPCQAQDYTPLLLPPYQFEKVRHWMEQKQAPHSVPAPPTQLRKSVPDTLLEFVGYTDKKGASARFKVNTSITAYETLLSGHIIANTAPICPATVQLDLAIEASRILLPEIPLTEFHPEIQNVQNHAALCRDLARLVWVDLDREADKSVWAFKITSNRPKSSDTVTHTTGRLVLRAVDDHDLKSAFARFERLKTHQRCLELLNNPNTTEIIQGRNIYRAFADVVDYSPRYQGLQKLVGHEGESAGRVSQSYNSETWLDPLLSDAFCQVAGIYANCMTDRSPDDMYIACDIELWMRSPKTSSDFPRPGVYHILASNTRPARDTIISDIFVFDGNEGTLLEVILGVRYRAVKRLSMQRMLTKLTSGARSAKTPAVSHNADHGNVDSAPTVQETKPSMVRRDSHHAASNPGHGLRNARIGTKDQIQTILSSFLGVHQEKILDNSDLADLGVDSLMAMELVSEIERKMSCSLNMDEIVEVTTVSGLIRCVSSALSLAETIDPDTLNDLSGEESSRSISNSSVSESTPLTDPITPEERTFNASTHLVQFLGLDQDSIDSDTALRDLGVDSLLAIELRADLASNFGFHFPMDQCLEDLNVGELEIAFGHKSASSKVCEVTSKLGTLTMPSLQQLPKSSETETGLPGLAVAPLELPPRAIEEAFAETKNQTDQQFADFKCQDYYARTLPQKTDLCLALIVEALGHLGCDLQTLDEGEELLVVECRPENEHLRDHLYRMLEVEAGLVSFDGDRLYRSGKKLALAPSQQILDRILLSDPGEESALQLIYYAGSHLVDILSGKTDGIKLIFGSEKGRKMVSSLYGDWPINRLMYRQIENFLSALSKRLSSADGTLKILEMGAGTGGTTQWLIPLLAKLPTRVQYTFTDLAPSFVASARKRFSQYDFIKYMSHDIEKPPPIDLQGSQHIVIASNAVHATHNLTRSTSNIRQFLRPDGVLMMVEMTTPLLWVDIIFGLFEGWWFFDDGRKHAVTNEEDWKRHLLAAGYGSVDWTNGQRLENKLEKLIIATVPDPQNTTVDSTLAISATNELAKSVSEAIESRAAKVEHYVQQVVDRFIPPAAVQTGTTKTPSGICVVVTGGSGSLGSHLVSNLVERGDVHSVICLNRPHKGDAHMHQLKALISRGILVSSQGLAKLRVFEGDMTQPMLGLQERTYRSLVDSATCVVHNAWTMSATRPIAGFENQLHIMSKLLTLARDIASCRPPGWKTGFFFVSSIAVVGQYPTWKGTPHVPEDRVPIEAVLPNGYGDAKWACELALDRTLHKYPTHFGTSSVRIGQIAGSRKSGYWNPMEHSAFLWKSSQTLHAIPAFDGLLSWTPVDDVAGTLADLIAVRSPYPIYNIDNPVRQPWNEMIPVLANALAIPKSNIIPFADWIARVRQSTEVSKNDNPAYYLLEFLEDNFLRMSCGGLLLDTRKAQEHSPTLRKVQPVSEEVARRFVQAWKDMRFLSDDGHALDFEDPSGAAR
ncbi:MAG: hypothetical protein Q9165_008495 [Trypethelium subeluteriae]